MTENTTAEAPSESPAPVDFAKQYRELAEFAESKGQRVRVVLTPVDTKTGSVVEWNDATEDDGDLIGALAFHGAYLGSGIAERQRDLAERLKASDSLIDSLSDALNKALEANARLADEAYDIRRDQKKFVRNWRADTEANEVKF